MVERSDLTYAKTLNIDVMLKNQLRLIGLILKKRLNAKY